VATGKVVDACLPRHRHQEFLRFLKQVAKAYPRRRLHIVCDNYATHKHPTVKAWLARNPRITLHFTPTSGSWLNLVEINRPSAPGVTCWRRSGCGGRAG
jgi:transposase